MEFNKVEDGIAKGLPSGVQPSCVHKCVPWCKRIFYYGTTPVTDPYRNCTTSQCFPGGYCNVYQIPGWNYYPFSKTSDYNYAHDQIFPIKDHMYMLVYSKFDGFYFYGINQWNDDTGGWKDISVYRNGDSTMSRDSDCSVVACNTCDQETAYVLVLSDNTGQLKVFELKKNATYDGYIDMNVLCTIDNAWGFTPCCLTHACVKDQKLYAFGGTRQQCNVIWDPCKILTVCLQSYTAQVQNCLGDNEIFPPFTNNGPQCAVKDNDKWVMLGGVDANGTVTRDIWVLNLNTFQWRRSDQQIPDNLNIAETCATQLDSILFVADKQNAICNFPIANL